MGFVMEATLDPGESTENKSLCSRTITEIKRNISEIKGQVTRLNKLDDALFSKVRTQFLVLYFCSPSALAQGCGGRHYLEAQRYNIKKLD